MLFLQEVLSLKHITRLQPKKNKYMWNKVKTKSSEILFGNREQIDAKVQTWGRFEPLSCHNVFTSCQVWFNPRAGKKNLLNTKINVLPNDLSFYRNRHLPSLSAPTKLQLGPDKPKVVCQPPLPHIQKITLNMWKPHGSETDPERNRNGFFIASEPERKSEMWNERKEYIYTYI